MFCYKCGNQLEDDAVFCPLCGAKNDEEENQPSVKVNDNYYAPPRAKKGVPWKIIIPSAVIAAAVILFFAFGRNPYMVKIGDKMYRTSMTDGLDLSGKNLTNSDIVNLQYMTKITHLWLEGNNISDISPLSELTNLELLSLEGNNISDISPLTNLTNLELLILDDNSISDISPLSNLTNLEYLSLDQNSISDISPLSNLTNLKNLSLGQNSISDISPLSNLTNLEFVFILSYGDRPDIITVKDLNKYLSKNTTAEAE